MSDSAFYYPELDAQTLKNLEIIRQLALDHPSYLLTAPYSGDQIKMMEEWFKPKKVVHEVADAGGEMGGSGDWEFLYAEARRLYTQLQAAGVGMDDADKMSYFRTSATLLEKLLGMQERANNLKHISDFYQIVMDVMEDTLTPVQRTSVMERLDTFVKGL